MGQETNSDTHGIYIDPHDRLSHGGRVAALPPESPARLVWHNLGPQGTGSSYSRG